MRIGKVILCLALMLSLLNITTPSFAGDPVRKLGRGLANIGTGFLEVPRNVVNVTEEDGYAAGATYGVLKGAAWAVLRTAVGVYETVTFFIPMPLNYDPILKPEFLLGEEY